MRPIEAGSAMLVSAFDPKRTSAQVMATQRFIGLTMAVFALASCSDAPRIEKSGRINCERMIELSTPASLEHVARQLVSIAGDNHLGVTRDSATENALRDEFGQEPLLLYLTRTHGNHEALHVAAMRLPPGDAVAIQVYVDGTDEHTARQLCSGVQRISTSAPIARTSWRRAQELVQDVRRR